MRCPKARLVAVDAVAANRVVAVDSADAVAAIKVVAVDAVAENAVDAVAENAVDAVVENASAQRLSNPNHRKIPRNRISVKRSDRGRFLRDPAPFLCAFRVLCYLFSIH